MTKLEKLQKKYREKMARLKELRKVETRTAAQNTELTTIIDDMENLGEEIDNEQRVQALEDEELFNEPSFDLETGKWENNRSSSNNDLIFQAADGREHRAISVSKRFSAGETQQGLDGIGPGSLGKIIRAKILGDPMGLNESERRAMGEGVGGAGGWFVNPLVSGYVIDLARNASCCMKAGAWTLPMDSPEVTLVKVLTDPTAYWLPEHGAISESDGSFAPIKLKSVILGTMVRVSQALLEDAPSAGQTIEKMLSSALGLELDRVALLGQGGSEPRGLYHCSDINEYLMGENGAAPPDYDPFSYAAQYVLQNNGMPTAAIMAPRTFGTLDRLKAATTNQPLVAPQSYQDLKKFYTNQVPVDQIQGTSEDASCAFVGDFKNVVVGMRKSLTIDVSPHAGTNTFANVECLIRAYLRCDIAILRENHFTKIVGITE